MILEIEGEIPVYEVSEKDIVDAIRKLRSYGPSSFASLTDDVGNYLQVAGGGVTCMLERRDAAESRHYRAFKNERSKVFDDGTVLAFGGGEIKMMSDEWIKSSDVENVFRSFLKTEAFPPDIFWRDVSHMFD